MIKQYWRSYKNYSIPRMYFRQRPYAVYLWTDIVVFHESGSSASEVCGSRQENSHLTIRYWHHCWICPIASHNEVKTIPYSITVKSGPGNLNPRTPKVFAPHISTGLRNLPLFRFIDEWSLSSLSLSSYRSFMIGYSPKIKQNGP
jgi:hypothetical protein